MTNLEMANPDSTALNLSSQNFNKAKSDAAATIDANAQNAGADYSSLLRAK